MTTAPHPHARIVPLVVACPLFLQNLDTSIMATALPSIAASLQVKVLDLNLAITAYLLSLVIFLPLSGWLAERFGPRRMFCTAILLFSLGSALCGAANSLSQLVVFRLMQGMGGALMVPVGRLILLRSIPAAQMVGAMVWFTVPGAIGRLTGPLFGGAIVTVTSWRWIFLINIPFCLIGLAMAFWFIEPDGPPQPENTQPFDVRGFLLLALGLGGLLGGLEMVGRSLLPWPAILAMGCAGALAMWGYHRHSRRRTEPLIDLGIFSFPTFRITVLGAVPLRIAVGAVPFLVPLLLQVGFGLAPLDAGLLTMASALGALATRTVLARLIRRFGFRHLLMGAAVLASCFYAGYSLFTPNTPPVLIFVVLMLGGLFNAMAMVTLNTLGFVDIPRPRMSHATAASSMAQQLSISLGVVIGASLLTAANLLHGGDGTHLHAADFMPAFLIIGTITLGSAWAFSRLADEAGDQLRQD